jgi:hypothetical protein
VREHHGFDFQARERPARGPEEARRRRTLRSATRSDLSEASFQNDEMLRARGSATGREPMLPKVQSHMKPD